MSPLHPRATDLCGHTATIVSMDVANPELNQLAMDLLEYRFLETSLRCCRQAKAIAFDLRGPRRETWICDPRSSGRLFEKRDDSTVGLRIECRPEMLIRLASESGFRVAAEDEFDWHGDLELLDPLIDVLRPARSSIALRAGLQRGEWK